MNGYLKFGKLTIIKEVEKSKDGHKQVLCQCDCGEKFITKLTLLRSKRKNCCNKCKKKHFFIKHGMRNSRIYRIWSGMKNRCYNQNSKDFIYYGKRNIVLCDEWKNDFQNFYNWAVNNGYDDSLTIERINVNDNYSPQNCCWIKREQQACNKTNNVFIKYNDKILTASECAKFVGISPEAMCQRIKRHPQDARIFNKQWKDEKWKNQYTI